MPFGSASFFDPRFQITLGWWTSLRLFPHREQRGFAGFAGFARVYRSGFLGSDESLVYLHFRGFGLWGLGQRGLEGPCPAISTAVGQMCDKHTVLVLHPRGCACIPRLYLLSTLQNEARHTWTTWVLPGQSKTKPVAMTSSGFMPSWPECESPCRCCFRAGWPLGCMLETVVWAFRATGMPYCSIE